jgi:hypothetical protein
MPSAVLCDVPPPIMENIGGVLLERVSKSDKDPDFLDRTVRRFSQQFAHEVGITSPAHILTQEMRLSCPVASRGQPD